MGSIHSFLLLTHNAIELLILNTIDVGFRRLLFALFVAEVELEHIKGILLLILIKIFYDETLKSVLSFILWVEVAKLLFLGIRV
jgi:hypothetical protein